MKIQEHSTWKYSLLSFFSIKKSIFYLSNWKQKLAWTGWCTPGTFFNLRAESKVFEHAQISELFRIFTGRHLRNTGHLSNCTPSSAEIAFKNITVFWARILRDYPLISLKNRWDTSIVYILASSTHLVVVNLDGNFLLAHCKYTHYEYTKVNFHILYNTWLLTLQN